MTFISYPNGNAYFAATYEDLPDLKLYQYFLKKSVKNPDSYDVVHKAEPIELEED